MNIGRNELCPCGSGKKFKKCCEGRKTEAKPDRQPSAQEISAHLQRGLHHHQSGKLQQAEAIYRQVLAADPQQADALHLLGLIASHTGHLPAAVELIGNAIKIAPDTALYHESLGRALTLQGQRTEAVIAYQRALQLNPKLASSHNDLGVVLLSIGNHDEAEKSFRRALELNDANPEAHYNLASALLQSGQHQPASSAFEKAIRLKPDYAEAHNNLGNALVAQGQHESAINHYRAAIKLQPRYADAHNNLGCVLSTIGQWAAAIECHQVAINLQPDYPAAHNNLGNALKGLERFDDAMASYREAIRLLPQYPEALNNLGTVLVASNQLEEAFTCFGEALRLNPNYADALNNQGNLLVKQNRLDEAAASYEKVLELNADAAGAHLSLAFVHLVQGNFARGWREFEWRWQTGSLPPPDFSQPRWTGDALQGRTLLLYEEQGFGDTIQFVRYAALAKEQLGEADSRIIVRCQPALARLLSNCASVDAVIKAGDELPHFDVQAPMMSLPFLRGTTGENIPAAVPYLFADETLAAQWKPRLLSSRRKVGICWQGNPKHLNDRNRSFPLELFAPLTALDDIQFFSLQKGIGSEQLTHMPPAFKERVTVLEEMNNADWDFMDTAAVLTNLDLVITPDTALAHLAGALGIRVWMLTPFAPDWRWLLEREDSPWYPSMRLFRQSESGNWQPVFMRLQEELKKFSEG